MVQASSQPFAHRFGNILSKSSCVNHADIPAPATKVHVLALAEHRTTGEASEVGLAVGLAVGLRVGLGVGLEVGDG